MCECDRQFARAHKAVTDVFNEDYHLFWSKVGWEPENSCSRGSGGSADPQCCGSGNKNQAFVSFTNNDVINIETAFQPSFRYFTTLTKKTAVPTALFNQLECVLYNSAKIKKNLKNIYKSVQKMHHEPNMVNKFYTKMNSH